MLDIVLDIAATHTHMLHAVTVVCEQRGLDIHYAIMTNNVRASMTLTALSGRSASLSEPKQLSAPVPHQNQFQNLEAFPAHENLRETL